MVRLRRVSAQDPGWTRVRRGRGFSYHDADGTPLADADVARCKELVIPPAWERVWICPAPNGHLQAVGTDDAGRRQYLYHPQWRTRRDAEKFIAMQGFARALLRRRTAVRRRLGEDGYGFERVAATAFGLLDLGIFRIGSEQYVEANESHGLTTLDRSHVTVRDEGVDFAYTAKSGQELRVTVRDDRLAEVLRGLRYRRSGGDRLLAYKDGGRWRTLDADELNTYIRDRLQGDVTAKTFRTWRANVIAASCLSRSSDVQTVTGRKKAVTAAMKEVAEHLGNTPAIARSSYVDPRITDLYSEGVVVADRFRPVAPGAPVSRNLERAVLRLLDDA